MIMDASDVKLFLPGITDDKTLEKASKICDKVSFKQKEQGHDKERRYYTEHEVMTPGMIRALHDRSALCIRANRSPVLIHIPRVIRDPDYLWARLRGHDVADVQAVMARRQLAAEQLAASASPGAADVITTLQDGQPVPAGNGHPSNGHRHVYPCA